MMISWQVSRECSTLRLNVRMRRLTTTRGSRGTTPAGWLTELSSAPTVRLLASSALIHHDYSAPDKGAEYCDERVCVCVCLSEIISSELHVRSSPNFCACYRRGRGSVFLWRHSNALYTSGFMDDVMFAHKPRWLVVAAQLKRSAHAALGLAINCAQ